MTAEQFCISEAIEFARSMSYRDCLEFLRGFVLLAGESVEAQPLREVIAELQQNDRQLELIRQYPMQMPLPMAPTGQINGSKPDHRRTRGNTKMRSAERKAFLLRHAAITDADELTKLAFEEGLYSQATGRNDARSTIERSREHMVNLGELLRS